MGTVKYTGPVASFHCPTEATIRSLKVHFSPKQLGEGTPSPENVREIRGWDGVEVISNSKNLFDTSKISCSHPSTTWNAQTEMEDMIFANGELSGTVQSGWRDTTVFTQNTPFKPGTYTLSFDYVNGIKNYSWKPVIIASTYSGWYSSYKSVSVANQDSGNVVTTFTADKPFYIAICLNSFNYAATTAKNKIYNIQLELGSTATYFEPCNASLIDYEFGVLGKNKFDYANANIIDAKRRDDNGNEVADGSGSYSSALTPVSPSTTYTASGFGTNMSKRVYYIDADENFLSRSDIISNNTFTFTTPSNCHYVQFQSGRVDNSTWSDVQLELGSTATTYEPYDPNHTVYGGWVDLISGEVQQEWAHVIIDENTLFYMATRQNYAGNYFYQEFNNEPDKQCLYTAGKLTESMRVEKSNQFEIQNSWGEASINQFSTWAYANADTRTTIRFGFPSELNITSVDAAKSWFIENGSLEIIYPLVAPISYHLAPTTMQTFLSTNNVWSNADYVEVEYDLHETQTILARKQFIVANQPHIVKPAAAPLQNFVTDVAAPLKECKIHFAPVQEGAGDPSPDNVMAISGWTGIEVEQRNKNLLSNYENGYFHTFIPAETKLVASSDIPTSGNNQVRFYRADKTEIDYWTLTETYTDNRRKRGFTPHEDCYYWRFNNNDLNVQLELGFVATDYEPYQGTTLPIDWTDSTGIVYGGYVDLVTGEVWKTWHLYRLPKLTSSNCTMGSQSYIKSDATDVFVYPAAAYRQYPSVGAQSVDYSPVCNRLTFANKSIWGIAGYPNCWTLNGGQVHINISNDLLGITNYTEETTTTAKAKVIEYMNAQYDAGNYFDFAYKIAPILITTLTPTTLKTLRGTNNIWANNNGGNIEVAFWRH